MAERTYNQYCPIAHALDLIGDRWTLLICRDLLLGPKRFSDLHAGRPGIGTNILTDRLKGLDHAGLVQRRVLPPPAASAVYELTPYGHGIEPALVALAQWGGQSLGVAQPGQLLSRDSVLLTVRALARHLPTPDVPVMYAFALGDPQLPPAIFARTAEGEVEVSTSSADQADVVFQLNVDTLFALAGGLLSLQAAIERGSVALQGALELLEALGISSERTSSQAG